MSEVTYNGGYLFSCETQRSHDMASWALQDFVAHKAFYHASKSKKDFEEYMRRTLPQAVGLVSCQFDSMNDILVFVIKASFRNDTFWGEARIAPQERIFNITKMEKVQAAAK